MLSLFSLGLKVGQSSCRRRSESRRRGAAAPRTPFASLRAPGTAASGSGPNMGREHGPLADMDHKFGPRAKHDQRLGERARDRRREPG